MVSKAAKDETSFIIWWSITSELLSVVNYDTDSENRVKLCPTFTVDPQTSGVENHLNWLWIPQALIQSINRPGLFAAECPTNGPYDIK